MFAFIFSFTVVCLVRVAGFFFYFSTMLVSFIGSSSDLKCFFSFA